MEIKYIEMPIRVKPHNDYLDTKGVIELWEKIKEYVREHGGENAQGAVNEAEVNKLIADYYKAHKDELKGEPFTYADFTEAQLALLKGEKGEDGQDGKDGKDGVDGTVTFEELTDTQKESLKGDKGDKGDPLTWDDLTDEQKLSLKGEKGDKGADGTMTFSDLTEEQKESLKGDKGDRGEKGDAFTFEDFTPEQLESLKGLKGDKGDKGDKGEQGERGIQGIQGIQGVQGLPGSVDYSLVYTKTEIDNKLKDLDFDFDVDLGDINLDNYYNKSEIDTKFDAIEIEGSTGVHVGDDVPDNPLIHVWVDTDGIPYDGDADIHELFYTKEDIDTKLENYKHNLSEMVNDIGFITEADIPTRTSQLNNDAGFLTSQEAYTKGSVYNKAEVDALINGYTPDTALDAHNHDNKETVLDKLSVIDGKLAYNGVAVDTDTQQNIDLSGLATESALTNGLATKANKEHTHKMADITDYVAPTIPSLDGYATEAYVTQAIAGLSTGGDVNLDGYATEQYVTDTLNTELAKKANKTHTHSSADLTDGKLIESITYKYCFSDNNKTIPSNWYTSSELADTTLPDGMPGRDEDNYKWVQMTTNFTDGTNDVGHFVSSVASATGTGINIGMNKTTTVTGAEIFNDYANNTATKEYAHAEGKDTDATGKSSHSEGYSTTASGDYSHAEGFLCKASNTGTHAEGYGSDATAQYAHAEGYYTDATGTASHAEGYYTIASGNSQHVQGKYNKSDTSMAHIIGNGTSSSERANIHTVDWSGNAWYQGEVRVGGTSYTDALPLLRYQVVTEAPTEQVEGVLYIVTG